MIYLSNETKNIHTYIVLEKPKQKTSIYVYTLHRGKFCYYNLYPDEVIYTHNNPKNLIRRALNYMTKHRKK
jgi:hypothetical protein